MIGCVGGIYEYFVHVNSNTHQVYQPAYERIVPASRVVGDTISILFDTSTVQYAMTDSTLIIHSHYAKPRSILTSFLVRRLRSMQRSDPAPASIDAPILHVCSKLHMDVGHASICLSHIEGASLDHVDNTSSKIQPRMV